jgi:hypothetical protein
MRIFNESALSIINEFTIIFLSSNHPLSTLRRTPVSESSSCPDQECELARDLAAKSMSQSLYCTRTSRRLLVKQAIVARYGLAEMFIEETRDERRQ